MFASKLESSSWTRARLRLVMTSVLIVAVVAGLLVVGPLVPASAARSCGPPSWQVVPTPNEGTGSDELLGITAISPTDAWAVGEGWDEAEDHTVALIERWDGTGWSVASSPPAGDSSGLFAVDAVASNDVWAVGYMAFSEQQVVRALTQHWDGTSWETVEADIPDAGPWVTTIFADVLALAPDDVWAVGRWAEVPDSPTPSPLIEHWDGSDWEVVNGPDFDTWSELKSVSGTGPDDIWFVGSTEVFLEGKQAFVERALIEHWDGEAFTVFKAPFNRRHPLNPFDLEDVVALSPTDAWAVGSLTKANGRTVNLTFHWDGKEWTRVPVPNPSGTFQWLSAVTAVSPERVVAVGRYLDDETRSSRTFVTRWNGERWRKISSANTNAGSELYDVTSVDGWRSAVGSSWSNRSGGRYRTLALQPCSS